MSKIDNRRRPAVNHLQAAAELTPEHVRRTEQRRGEIAGCEVLQQRMVGMSAFELRLPHMVMGVDKAWTDDFVHAIDDLGVVRGNVRLHFDDLVTLDQDVRLDGFDMVVLAVYESCSILEEK